MGSVKPVPKTREPVVVMVTSKVVVDLVVFILMVSQEIGVKVTVGEPGVSTAVLTVVTHSEGSSLQNISSSEGPGVDQLLQPLACVTLLQQSRQNHLKQQQLQ